jgi:hypothetical protein
MAALPPVPLAVGTTLVGGTEVPIRSLTRAEALELRALAGQPDADRLGEVYLIAKGTGVDPADAEAWWESSDPVAVQKLVRDIAVVSRLQGEDGKDPNSAASAPSSRGSST